jgi:hypothetical protein
LAGGENVRTSPATSGIWCSAMALKMTSKRSRGGRSRGLEVGFEQIAEARQQMQPYETGAASILKPAPASFQWDRRRDRMRIPAIVTGCSGRT